MGDTPITKRPWFFILSWLFVLAIAYLWEIVLAGGIILNEVRLFVDLFIIFPFLLLVWMAFFSQFVLPVQTIGDRFRIFSRVLARVFGSHGPAIFIKNGVEEKEEGEERRKGPGVLWLDTASGAVVRTATKITKTIGPGVHFIRAKESIAGTVDLHTQVHSFGPKDSEKPFDEKKESQTEEEYLHIQDRRKLVSALTRDGIEIVPNISVTFRVNTGFPEKNKPGSRFGYRTGVTKKDKRNEEEDKKAIEKAILGESINPNYTPEMSRHRVAWNQLPSALAVDVWREYAAKFTLDQFLKPTQEVPAPAPSVIQPTEEEVDPLTQAIQITGNRDALQVALARMLRQVNVFLARWINRLERAGKETAAEAPAPSAPAPPPPANNKPEKKTAFQVINDMVKARLTQQFVDSLDDIGVRKVNAPLLFSREYEQLQKRGLQVLNVSISNPRVNPSVESHLVGDWEANWLEMANAEKDQIKLRQSLAESTAQEKAVEHYADELSQALLKDKPTDMKGSLKRLLARTRSMIIRNNKLRQVMKMEQQELEEMLRWIEVNGR